MQLEQQENFTIHGPQLEILGKVETKLPGYAPLPTVLPQEYHHSVLGIGGAKLKGVYRETAEIYTSAQDEYGHSIQGDFEAQADAAANLIKQAGYVDSTPAAALQEAEDALAAWNDTDDSPAVQYAANRRLYNAVDTLYASLNNKVDDSTQRALDDQYNAFVSAQATIERAANVYNLWVEDYEKAVSQFPANLISGLWGAQAPERFATK